MVALWVILAIVVAGLPLTAVVLVTVACRQEETAHSMAGSRAGRLEARPGGCWPSRPWASPGPHPASRRPATLAAAEPLTMTGAGAPR